jgi:hypothetical protein
MLIPAGRKRKKYLIKPYSITIVYRAAQAVLNAMTLKTCSRKEGGNSVIKIAGFFPKLLVYRPQAT